MRRLLPVDDDDASVDSHAKFDSSIRFVELFAIVLLVVSSSRDKRWRAIVMEADEDDWGCCWVLFALDERSLLLAVFEGFFDEKIVMIVAWLSNRQSSLIRSRSDLEEKYQSETCWSLFSFVLLLDDDDNIITSSEQPNIDRRRDDDHERYERISGSSSELAPEIFPSNACQMKTFDGIYLLFKPEFIDDRCRSPAVLQHCVQKRERERAELEILRNRTDERLIFAGGSARRGMARSRWHFWTACSVKVTRWCS